MPASQSRFLLLSLLTGSLIATTSWADTVIINTTNDENNIDNSSCSIREAVNYLKAKNEKKAIIDEEIAVISGLSTKLETEIIIAKENYNNELKKTNPNPDLLSQLKQKRDDLLALQSSGLKALNEQLRNTTDELNKEQSKASPDQNIIKTLENTISTIKASIAAKESEKTKKTEDLSNYKKAGLYGCFSKEDNNQDNVYLKKDIGVYLVNSPITINIPLNFAPDNTDNNDDLLGLDGLENTDSDIVKRAIIKANNSNRLFIIDDGINNDHDNDPLTADQRIKISFNDIDLDGCKSNCANDGGIILNKEELFITNSIMSNGSAIRGGAIYNDERAILSVNYMLFKNNIASDGATIYSRYIAFSILNSLFTENSVSDTNNGIVSINSNALSMLSTVLRPYIENSTFSGNTGTALSVQQGLIINNVTIVNNTIGINFNNGLPTIYNSIIGNNQIDCKSFLSIPNDGKSYFSNNLSVIGKGCPTTDVIFNNIFITNTDDQQLIAATDAKGLCAAPPAYGLLCPLADNGGQTKTHKPRLLAKYLKVSDSPIINKGFTSINSSNKGLNCSGTDQRGKTRENKEDICDIGSVELTSGLATTTQGDDISFGQVKVFSPLTNLGDAELLPASLCSSVLGAGEYLNGCIKLVDLPRYGTVKFDVQTGEMIYKTNDPNFHGFDRFSYSVVTTLSRFNDAINDRTLKTNVKVVSEPPTSPPSKSLDNGSIGLFSLIAMSILAIFRRIIRG